MGLIQIIKDKYIIWHHERKMNAMEKRAEYHETFFLIDKNYFKLSEEYSEAIKRESERLWKYIEKRFPEENLKPAT